MDKHTGTADLIEYTGMMSGDIYWMSECGLPIAELLEREFEENGAIHCDLSPGSPYAVGSEPVMDVSFIIPCAVGALTFVATWAASKLLDEFYTNTLRPKLTKLFEKMDEDIETKRVKPGAKTFHFTVVWRDIDRAVAVAVTGNTFAEISAQLDQLGPIHTDTLQKILVKPGGRVHFIPIRNGLVGAPTQHDTLRSGLAHLSSDSA